MFWSEIGVGLFNFGPLYGALWGGGGVPDLSLLPKLFLKVWHYILSRKYKLNSDKRKVHELTSEPGLTRAQTLID
jgi:hypothetical protein